MKIETIREMLFATPKSYFFLSSAAVVSLTLIASRLFKKTPRELKKEDLSIKNCFILMGLPGSGKTSTVFRLQHFIQEHFNKRCEHISTDHQFLSVDPVSKKLVYRFDINRLLDAHKKTQDKALALFQEGAPFVVIDNCNLRNDYRKKYSDPAKHHGYKIFIVEPKTWWKHNVFMCYLRNTHRVPFKEMWKMNRDKELPFEDLTYTLKS
jgi:predicted kinase